MSIFRAIRRGMWSLTHRRDADRNVSDEVAHYLAETEAMYVAGGMSPADARRAARMALGSEDNVREQVRSFGWENVVEAFGMDLRYAARQLLRTPFFTIACAVSMGMGIAITVVAYSRFSSMLFKPLPVPDRDNVVHVFAALRGDSFGTSSYPAFEDYREQKAFSIVAYAYGYATLSTNNRAPEQRGFTYVSPDYFDVLGVTPRAGRALSRAGDVPEIVISDTWRRQMFDDDDRILGATVSINRVPFTIVGIAPRGFHGLGDNEGAGWVPAGTAGLVHSGARSMSGPEDRNWHVVGRLAPGVATASAAARLQPVVNEYAKAYRAWRDINVPLEIRVLTHAQKKRVEVSEYLGEALVALAAIIAVVLVLACTNVAGMLLARSVTRRHEVAVRLTLGATRGRLATQFFVESVVIALLGGLVGWVFAHWLVMLSMRNPLIGRIDFDPDWRVMLATGATCFMCALLFGAMPIAHALRIDVRAGLSGTGVVGDRGGVRSRLLALQVCLACMLIVLGLHASRGIVARVRSTTNIEVAGILAAELQPWGVREIRDSVQLKAYVQDAETTLRMIPGVLMTSPTPALEAAGGIGGRQVSVELPGAAPVPARLQKVRLDYFDVLRVGVRQGHIPRTASALPGRRTAVVSRAFLDSIGRNVVGSTVHLANEGDIFIAAEIHTIRTSQGIDRPVLYEIVPEGAFGLGSDYLIARVQPGREKDIVAAFTRAMRVKYPHMAPPQSTTLQAHLDVHTAPQRYVARAALAFGVAELVLAGIGLYSILLYSMLTRTREIGIRMALGAQPARAGYAVMKEGLSSIAVGLLLGIVVAIPGTMIAIRKFPGASATDVVPLAFAIFAIAGAAAAACIGPARQAARVQPMDALRHE